MSSPEERRANILLDNHLCMKTDSCYRTFGIQLVHEFIFHPCHLERVHFHVYLLLVPPKPEAVRVPEEEESLAGGPLSVYLERL